MTVPRKIANTQPIESLILSLIHTGSEAWVQYINLDREVLNPPPCG